MHSYLGVRLFHFYCGVRRLVSAVVIFASLLSFRFVVFCRNILYVAFRRSFPVHVN